MKLEKVMSSFINIPMVSHLLKGISQINPSVHTDSENLFKAPFLLCIQLFVKAL